MIFIWFKTVLHLLHLLQKQELFKTVLQSWFLLQTQKNKYFCWCVDRVTVYMFFLRLFGFKIHSSRVYYAILNAHLFTWQSRRTLYWLTSSFWAQVWRYQTVIRSNKSKNDKQYIWSNENGQTTITNTTQKTKDRATRTPLTPGVNSGAPEGSVVPDPLVAPVVLF